MPPTNDNGGTHESHFATFGTFATFVSMLFSPLPKGTPDWREKPERPFFASPYATRSPVVARGMTRTRIRIRRHITRTR